MSHCIDGLNYYHACAPVSNGEDMFMERPDKRDENVKRERAGKGLEVIEE